MNNLNKSFARKIQKPKTYKNSFPSDDFKFIIEAKNISQSLGFTPTQDDLDRIFELYFYENFNSINSTHNT